MFKWIKNKFLFIILISIATLIILIVGALSLHKDNYSTFASEGYIIETTEKVNNKYYFSANTKYKENVDEKITFRDVDSNKVAIEQANFVHYLNGNISFLKRGAMVNLAELNSPMISYYNITNQNTIVYENGQYVVTSNDKKINIESFVGRINDNKYLIAGKDISLKIPNVEERIKGEYFEILYLEKGIIKIDNQESSYQVAAQNSYIYIGDNITISLEEGKIFYDGEAKMLLSQITINGNENIDLDVEKNNGNGSGTGSGNGTGNEDNSGDGNTTGEGNNTNDGNDNQNGSEAGTENGENSGNGSENGTGNNNGEGKRTTASPQIELIEAKITSTSIDLSLQLNNASLAKGKVLAYLTNLSTGRREYAKEIELVNGTFQIKKESLSPSTEFALTIVETNNGKELQYFQKTFKTKDLGITLEKSYATEDSLSYSINFDENTEVTKAHISIYDNNGTNTEITPNEFTISRDDLNNTITFTGLKSNTSYSINVDTVWINNTNYSNVYTINRIDSTLKQTPEISGVRVDTNTEEVKFTIQLNNIKDKDNSIISYTYNIYLADDINLENENPEVKYSITKNDPDALVLNLNEINELKTGLDYRCKIVAQYNDNEMIREVSTDYSTNFLIRSKPNISWEQESTTMNKVTGTITLIDANCTVPMNGRSCSNTNNTFTLRYYKLRGEETTENDTTISFNPSTLKTKISLSDLSSNTTYAVKVFGNYYDDDNVLHTNVQIGDAFYITTDKSENLYFSIIGDNISGTNKDGTENPNNVITFDAKLLPPKDSNIQEEISSITLNLYSGRYNVKDKLIGTYKITEKSDILDFFDNFNIRNSLFTDTTNNKLGKLDTLEKLIQVTNNSTNTLNGSYTVEVEEVLDSTGKNEFTIEDNVYTFNLTPSYYLDTRIETNPNDTYITATPITKENLTEEEYEKLSKTVKNLDDLNNDTVVGLTIENSLSDIFVDSAFTYEKVIVDYIIYNTTTKKTVKTISVDMGNKYQPKTQIVYLDSSELDDGNNYFTRGYKYRVSYNLNFTTEDGSNPTYTHDKLRKNIAIERQTPIIIQYISTSTNNDITYRYSIKDVDNALFNQNFYYTLEDKKDYQEITNSIIADNDYHEVTIPMDNPSNYSLYYAKKDTDNEIEYVSITNYDFEKNYDYNNEISYQIIDDNDNTLKLKLENNDFTNRAAAYKVVIKDSNNKISDYTRYFLASKLNTLEVDTNKVDEEGNKILDTYKYIGIDYANISKFMGNKMEISVYSYYDSGLVGLNQQFNNGMIWKDTKNNKFLNIYNSGNVGNTARSFTRADSEIMGINFLKEDYNKDDETINLYNLLIDTSNYDPSVGASYYDTKELSDRVGIKYNVSFTNAGILLNDGKTDYLGYNAKVLKEANLKTNNNKHQFDTIIPTIKVESNNNTINSLRINIIPSGIYGNKQFTKDGASHNKIYIDIYSDENLENKLNNNPITSDIHITGDNETGYSATIDPIEYAKNLTPATTYYFTVYAYINGVYTRLYDSSSKGTYITKTYSASTLDSTGILNSIRYSVTPKKYSGESSEKELLWRLGLKNTENYKIRFELFEKAGGTEENPTYKSVNFDGSPATTCDTSKNGTTVNGYVENCYISVASEDVQSINNQNQTYKFTGNNFVFGGNYYKLIVYAVPYSEGKYDEANKLIIYQNDSLTTTGRITSGGITYDITIPYLEEASFSLGNSLSAGYFCREYVQDGNCKDGQGYYYVSLVPTIFDEYKVMKYGQYKVILKDEKGNIIGANGDKCKYYINESTNLELKTSNECAITLDANEINTNIKFTGLSSNTLYYVELSYDTYRNNVGFTENQKVNTTPFTDFTYTPVAAGITLGTITAGQSTNKSVTLAYNGSSNLNNITKVEYTISLKGGSSKASGSYTLNSTNTNIFNVGTDKTPKLTIDVSESDNSSFSFRAGNTYIITTHYYHSVNGEDVLLTDQVTGNTTYTTILNL